MNSDEMASCRPLQTLLARALYDNVAELQQELNFKRGEILTVIKQNPEGYDGWWICNLKGKIGIAPGNRLDILGVVKNKSGERKLTTESGSSDDSYQTPNDHLQTVQENKEAIYENLPAIDDDGDEYDENNIDSEYCLPTENGEDSNRSSGISLTYQPQINHQNMDCKFMDDYLMLPLKSSSQNLPTHHHRLNNNNNNNNIQEKLKLSVRFEDPYLNNEYCNIPSSASSTGTLKTNAPDLSSASRDSGDEDSGASASSSGLSCDGPYVAHSKLLESLRRLSISSCDSIESRDMPISVGRPVKLPRSIALERFSSLQQGLSANSNKIFRFINKDWKKKESLITTAPIFRSTCHLFLSSLFEFLEFVHQVLENANECSDRLLPKKIWKHLKPMDEHSACLATAIGKLDVLEWKPEDIARLALTPETDYLSSIVNTIRNINIEVRSLTASIHGNAILLFPDTPSLSNNLPASTSAESLKRSSESGGLLRSLGNEHIKHRLSNSINVSDDKSSGHSEVATRETHTLQLYLAQIESHCDLLRSTATDFLQCLEQNRAPSIFVAHSKFLLKSATQLVYIANGLCTGLDNSEIKTRIETSANVLCESLKHLITETKTAAAEYPSPSAKQLLVNATINVKTSSISLKNVVREAAANRSVRTT